MALVSQILGQQRRVELIQGATVVSIDCSVSETHSRESPPTEFPLEDGSTISDHIIVKPFSLELHGIISDTPISVLSSVLTTVQTSTIGTQGLVTAAVGQALFTALAGSKKPSVQNYLQLLSLQEKRLPVSVITTLNRYENMFIKSISVPRDSGTSNALTFQLSMVQLLIVSPLIVNIKVFANNLGPKEANQGQQELTSASLQGFNDAQGVVSRFAGGR